MSSMTTTLDSILVGISDELDLDFLQDELDSMVTEVKKLSPAIPDEVIEKCTAYMARCTELYIQIVRVEGRERKLKYFRTTQLEKFMTLLDFTYKASSRMVEIRRHEVELSR